MDTFSFAPKGRKEKKCLKGMETSLSFDVPFMKRSFLNIKTKRSGLTLSEYIRRSLFDKEITARFSDEHIELYKIPIKYHNNFKPIGNMFKKRNPKLTQEVYDLANDIKAHF